MIACSAEKLFFINNSPTLLKPLEKTSLSSPHPLGYCLLLELPFPWNFRCPPWRDIFWNYALLLKPAGTVRIVRFEIPWNFLTVNLNLQRVMVKKNNFYDGWRFTRPSSYESRIQLLFIIHFEYFYILLKTSSPPPPHLE